MAADKSKPEEAIFKAAIQLETPAVRRAYILEACGSDRQLLAGVEALLQYHEASSFLDAPALDPDTCLDDPVVTEAPGTVIGRYKLLEKIGEGGMAVVYMAEQQEPIRRKVALKIIKLGMDTRQVIARFEAERQALALMDHPSIAKVLDAGATETGRPYFVMELVTGVSITEYCDQNCLGTKDRLVLFLQVCQAVQHAHTKGIIHRDIKPSNVMVTHHDGKPVPKVIDFGIAKATNQKLTEKTLFTRYAHIIGTPAYMSPEQAELSDLDIDTRSDIYSLGVLLYELLTGTTPFSEEELRKAGYVEMQRVIREQEPAKPSTRIKTALRSASVPARRGTGGTPVVGTDAKFCVSTGKTPMLREVRGDLDWIVMKSLEKDRSRRYETASGFAEDIRRHLESEPVLARAPSTAYRFRKLVRRNQGVFAAITVVASVLVLGALVSSGLAVRATRAQRGENSLRVQAEALAYASDMRLAQEALANNDLGEASRLLDAHRPAPGQVDQRGWEWRYLWQQCQSDALGEFCRYPNTAHAVAYSPDGNVLVVAGRPQQFVDLWDVSTRRRIRSLQPEVGHLAAFSPRGDLLATDAGDQIRLWQTGTWDPVGQLALNGLIRVLKFSPDGRRLASLSCPDDLTIWAVDQRPIVSCLHLRGRWCIPNSSYYGALDFSPDGKAIVVGDVGQRLRVFDLTSGSTDVNIPQAHAGPITAVAWSPKRSVIVSGGSSNGTIRLWDAATGGDRGKLEGHTAWISKLIFSADGRWLYSASADQLIRIWDVNEQRCLATLRGSRNEVHGLALAPDGGALASAGRDGVVAFWNARPRPREEQPRLIALGSIARPAFAPASRVLAAPRAGTVSLLDLTTFEEIERLPKLGDAVWNVAYAPDGTLLVTGSGKGRIWVWSCAEHRLLQELGDPNDPIVLLGFGADGKRLLSLAHRLSSLPSRLPGKAKVIWWDTLTWQAVRSFEVESYWNGAVSPDGRLLVVGDLRGRVRWLSAETGESLALAVDAHREAVQRIAFSRDGSQAASTDGNGTVAIWDVTSFRPIVSFQAHMGSAHGVAFSPDGRRLATGGDAPEAVKLWDSSTRRELTVLPGHGAISELAFSPDGQWLAACSTDGKLHLWHAPSWEEIEAAEKEPKDVSTP